MTLTIAITGGRTYKLIERDWFWLGGCLSALIAPGTDRLMQDIIIMSGAAKGVDSELGEALEQWGWNVIWRPANWEAYGKGAGLIRNEQMADECSLCLAFPGGPGTAHMIMTCIKYGKKVKESPTRKKE